MDKLTKKESRFVVEYVNGYDRYKSYKTAGYKAKSKESMAAAVSRLLKRPRIQEAITELEDAIEKSALVTPERIIANLADIAFDKGNNKADRIRSSELLGKNKKLWSEKQENSNKTLAITVQSRGEMPEEPKQETSDSNS